MEYTQAEILQTVAMTEMEHLDVRTVTLGLSLRDCVRASVEEPEALEEEQLLIVLQVNGKVRGKMLVRKLEHSPSWAHEPT